MLLIFLVIQLLSLLSYLGAEVKVFSRVIFWLLAFRFCLERGRGEVGTLFRLGWWFLFLSLVNNIANPTTLHQRRFPLLRQSLSQYLIVFPRFLWFRWRWLGPTFVRREILDLISLTLAMVVILSMIKWVDFFISFIAWLVYLAVVGAIRFRRKPISHITCSRHICVLFARWTFLKIMEARTVAALICLGFPCLLLFPLTLHSIVIAEVNFLFFWRFAWLVWLRVRSWDQ